MIVTQVLQSPYASSAELVELIPPHFLTKIILVNDRKRKKEKKSHLSRISSFSFWLVTEL